MDLVTWDIFGYLRAIYQLKTQSETCVLAYHTSDKTASDLITY